MNINRPQNLLKRFGQTINSFAGIKQAQHAPGILADRSISQNMPCDTICVIDTSGSMGWTDFKPSRLAAAIMAVLSYLTSRLSISIADRIGLVSFDTRGLIVLPLTNITDTQLIKSSVNRLKAGGGTDIAEGLKTAELIFSNNIISTYRVERPKKLLLLTDGRGGHPLTVATALKQQTVHIEVIGIAGDRSEVDETKLRKVATTDLDGFTHYRFIRDTASLIAHYEQLATGIVWKGPSE